MTQTRNMTGMVMLVVVLAAFFYFLAPILTPFLVAILLAYLVDPLIHKLMRLHLPRLLAVIVVFVFLFLLLTLLVLLLTPLIQDQITQLIEVIPAIVAWGQNTVLPWMKEYVGTQDWMNVQTLKTTLVENWAKAGGAAGWFLKGLLHSGVAMVAWIVNLVLIPVVTFYLLRDWDKLIARFRGLLPKKIEPTVVKLAAECDSVLGAFFRGQFLVMCSLGVIYSLGLALLGLHIGLLIGFIAGLASVVPYLGFIVGVTTASIVAFVQFGTMTSVLFVFLVFAVGQMMESMFLTPKLVGNRIGLHPVAVIFSVLAGGTLCGFFGVLLALPVAAVILVMLRFAYRHYGRKTL